MSKTNYEKICDFHGAIGPTPPTPTFPDLATLQLRQTLIQEEYQEVMSALAELTAVAAQTATPDMSNLAHELTDLLYVTYGTLAALGINADATFAEVHRANMTKLGGPRRADGKLLKPANWQPANVSAVIEQLKEGASAADIVTGIEGRRP